MVKKYSRNKSVRISGGKKEIDAAEKMLDSISDIDKEIPQFYTKREGDVRLQIQEAMEVFCKSFNPCQWKYRVSVLRDYQGIPKTEEVRKAGEDDKSLLRFPHEFRYSSLF